MNTEGSRRPAPLHQIHVLIALVSEAGYRRVAQVVDRSTCDIAFSAIARSVVIRCVCSIQREDYRVLKTMLAEGDFDRAVLVYCDAEQPHLSDEIESWSIRDVDMLAASLAGGAA